MPCALDRISSYTVSLLKRHYSIDDVLSRVSFPLQLLCQHTLNPRWLPAAGGGRQTVTITEFLVMVRVLWPSLHVIGARRRIIVHLLFDVPADAFFFF